MANTAHLHQAAALTLAESTSALGPDAFRFLRKALHLSQSDVANMLDLSKQTVSSWERGCVPLPRYADLLVRALVREVMGGNAALCQVVGLVSDPTRVVAQSVNVAHGGTMDLPAFS